MSAVYRVPFVVSRSESTFSNPTRKPLKTMAVATGDPRAKVAFVEKTAGRLAMTGFTVGTCYGAGNYTEQATQFLPLAVCLAGLITYASYKTDGIEVWPPNKPFTKGIETLNGRAAMLGLALKFVYEQSSFLG